MDLPKQTSQLQIKEGGPIETLIREKKKPRWKIAVAGASLGATICSAAFITEQLQSGSANAAASFTEVVPASTDFSAVQEKQLMLRAMQKAQKRKEHEAASRSEQRKPLENGQYWFGVHHSLNELEGREKHNAWLFYMVARRKGFSDQQIGCGDDLITTESKFNETAQNPSGAYGAVQALPGEKMAEAGPDWRTNVITQFQWFFNYYLPNPSHNYHGDPCEAEQHSLDYGWY